MKNLRNTFFSAAGVIALLTAGGCGSGARTTPQIAGQAVDSAQARTLDKDLVGKDAASADAKLGQPYDVYRDTKGSREWRMYPVWVYPSTMQVQSDQRYVVELASGRIVGVQMVSLDRTGDALAHNLMIDQKVMGKTMSECEAALGLGPPIVTARDEKTGFAAQLYAAKMYQGMSRPQYCRLSFDTTGHCNGCKLISVDASAGAVSPS